MTQRPALSKPPIKHAIIDFRLTQLGLATAEQLFEALKETGMTVERSRPFEAEVAFIYGKDATSTHKFGDVNGAIGRDAEYAATFALTGFNVTKNGKYSNYEDFVGKAKELWRKYVAIVHPCVVTRIGLRYINQFRRQSGPDAVKNMGSRTHIARDQYGVPTEFVARSMVQLTNATAIVGQSWSKPTDGWVSVVLDIDVFRGTSIGSEDETLLWETLDELREMKNTLFFESLHESIVKDFQ